MATGLQDGGPINQGSISDGSKTTFFSMASRLALNSTQSRMQWVLLDISQEIEWPGREANHSPPSSAEDNSAGVILPITHPFLGLSA
jgi:hypothetical protein